MKALAAVVLASACAVSHAQTAPRFGDIRQTGNVENTSGKISLSVEQLDGKLRGMLFVTDRTRVKSNLVMLDARELRALRAAIDATLAELEPQQPGAPKP